MAPSIVLSRSSPCNVPQEYASVAELPVALPRCHFEHPARVFPVALARTAHGRLCCKC
jgi:hypothetical protein